MTLQDRMAYWVDVGTVPYEATERLQESLVALRQNNTIPDVILAAQHTPEVNFSYAVSGNEFSEKFLKIVEDATGEINEANCRRVLEQYGLRFSRSRRGGYATVFSHGQRMFYPITHHPTITGKPMEIGAYKARIYRIMFETLQSLGVSGLQFNDQVSDQTLQDRSERRDMWISRNGISYKLGSKGLGFRGSIAYNGFSLYLDQSSTEHFWMINPCGYNHHEVSVTSVENETGRKVNRAVVDTHIQHLFKKHFGYNKIEPLSKEELLNKQTIEVIA